MLEPEFKILKMLNESSNISQRKMSKEVGVSLGKVNSILKKLSLEGYIFKNVTDKGIEYKVTDCGMDLLKNNLQETKSIRLQIHHSSNVKVKEAVILAAGNRIEFDAPVSLLNIKDFNLIERTIKLLKKSNIEKVILIAGYKSELFDYLKERNKDIEIIVNKEYSKSGTMKSLSVAKDVIKNDFILIESDLIYEEQALSELISSKERDCILLTNVSGSGDEAFVELRDGYLFKISKDIHQLNKIDGEVVGITKISYKLFNLMIEEFEKSSSLYINYEYTLLDVARNYNIGFTRINNLVWGEIDTTTQYEIVKEKIYPKILEKEERGFK